MNATAILAPNTERALMASVITPASVNLDSEDIIVL